MSLQIWLPLTKDTRQQGLSNINVTGTPASWGNGKLGKCATWNGAVANVLYNNTTDFNYTNNFSVAFWANPIYTGSATQYAWTVGRADAGGYGYGFQITNATTAYFRFGNGAYSVSAPSNEWHHFVMTIGNNKVIIYKDGVQVSSNNLPGTIPTYSDGNGMGLGCFHYSYNIYPYYGSLNDFRIYDHCLSPMEVKELAKGLVLHYPLNRQGWGQENLLKNSNFLQGTNGMQGYTATSATCTKQTDCMKVVSTSVSGGFYSSNFDSITTGDMTIFSADVKADSNMTIYIGTDGSGNGSCQAYTVGTSWQRISISKAKTTNNANLRIYGNGTFYAKNLKYELGSIATPWCPNSADALATTMGLNSTTEYDCSGFCNNGTRSGTFSWTSDTSKYAVSTKITPNSNIQFTPMLAGAYNWTVAAWIKPTVANNNGKAWFSIEQNTYWQVTCYSNQIGIRDNSIGGTGTRKNYSFGTVPANTWTHLVATYDNGTLKLYNNGVLQSTNTVGGSYLNAMNNGRWGSAVQDGYYLDGQMSDARIYATALSADDVLSLYQNSAYIDSSGNVYGAVHEEV